MTTDPPRALELILAAAALALLTAAVYGTHAIEGGFLSDDWAIHSTVEHSGGSLFDAIDALSEESNMSNRPLMVLYMALTHTVLEAHMGFHLAVAAALGTLMAWSTYLLLRLLSIERLHAGAIAALVVLFPAADSPRLWAGAAAGQLTVALYVLGVALAVLAFRDTGRRALILHGISVGLYLASILLHESTLVAIGATVLLYLAVATPRAAATRWAADVACASAVVLLVTLQSSAWPKQSFDGQVEHAKAIFDQGWTLLTAVALPLGDLPRGLVLAGLLGLLATAAAAIWRRRADSALARWTAVVAAGFAVVVTAYVIYVPAISYYAPNVPGIANRMNTLASIGYVLIVYGAIVLAASLVRRRLGTGAWLVGAVGVAGALVLSVGYVDRVAEDSRRFEQAYTIGAGVLWSLGQAVPNPPDGATVYAAGQPIEVAPGFPVYGNTWDLTGAARMMWNDFAITALPYFPGTRLECASNAIRPVNPRYGTTPDGAPLFKSEYGKTVLFHYPTGRAEVVRSRRQCESAAQWFLPGPEYVPVG